MGAIQHTLQLVQHPFDLAHLVVEEDLLSFDQNGLLIKLTFPLLDILSTLCQLLLGFLEFSLLLFEA